MSLNDLTAEELASLDRPEFSLNEKVTFGINKVNVNVKTSDKDGKTFKIVRLETKVLSGTNFNKPYVLVMTSYSTNQFMQLLSAVYGLEKVKARQMVEAEAVGKKIVATYNGSTTNDKGQTFDQWVSFAPYSEQTAGNSF